MVPMYDVYSALVYAAKAEDIHTVIIHGRTVVKERKLQTVDVKKITRDVLALTDEIKKKVEEL